MGCFKILLLIASIAMCISCEGNTSLDANYDSSDGDAEIEQELDITEGELGEHTGLALFACEASSCREGFKGEPSCLLPDEDKFLTSIKLADCTNDSDCESGEVCYPPYNPTVCVSDKLPNLTSYYIWDKCHFTKIAEYNELWQLVSVWQVDENLYRMLYSDESRAGKICINNDCVYEYDQSFERTVYNDNATCGGVDYVLLKNEQTYRLFKINANGDLISVDWFGDSANGYRAAATKSQILCIKDFVYVVDSGGIRKLVSDKLEIVLSVDDMTETSNDTSIDWVTINPENDSELLLSLTAPYSVHLARFNIFTNTYSTSSYQVESWQPSTFPVSKNKLLVILENRSVNLIHTDDDGRFEFLFNLGRKEYALGIDVSGNLITATSSRLFRYALTKDALPKAFDQGLAFPSEYRQLFKGISYVSMRSDSQTDQALVRIKYTMPSN